MQAIAVLAKTFELALKAPQAPEQVSESSELWNVSSSFASACLAALPSWLPGEYAVECSAV